jgi:hypothetical protein
MPAELSVVVARSDAALVVPKSALLGDFGSEFVFVEKDPEEGIFERVAIVRGLSDDRFVEIALGLLPGDRVATVGSYSLQFLPPYEGPAHAEGGPPHEETRPASARGRGRIGVWPFVLGAALVASAAAFAFLRARTRGRRASTGRA